ncbi:hypothetical protein SUGI_0645740 [Cryptomeria japonica]|uniref:uncharacterized protein LOC131041276 n=1 Tax=Cryptomeria japonica TaxID=3369 RepID=UPI002414B079|nr:uncharacterized protein LOC131041276 [Cryptomeria japonica]GLJ32066.1 hypothetical protein SUGI_0645740 [Cryptomeria japonica]
MEERFSFAPPIGSSATWVVRPESWLPIETSLLQILLQRWQAEAVGFDVLLKCQLPGEDLDALVSIKSDEELESILEEYDSLPTKFRVFLFAKPANAFRPVTLSGLSMPPVAANERVTGASGGDMKGARATISPKPRILQGLENHSCSVRKATKESTLGFNCIWKNLYQGGVLVRYCAHPQFLVKY